MLRIIRGVAASSLSRGRRRQQQQQMESIHTLRVLQVGDHECSKKERRPPGISKLMLGDWITSTTDISAHHNAKFTSRSRFFTTDKRVINATTNNLADWGAQGLVGEQKQEGEFNAVAENEESRGDPVPPLIPEPSTSRPQAYGRASKMPFVPLEDNKKSSSLDSPKRSDAGNNTPSPVNSNSNNNSNNGVPNVASNGLTENNDKHSHQPLQPRASNPSRFRAMLEEQQQQEPTFSESSEPHRKGKRRFRQRQRQLRRQQQQQQQRRQQQPRMTTVRQRLRRNKQWVPDTDWVVITNTSPTSSLESLLDGINDHMDKILLVQMEELQQQHQQGALSTTENNSSRGGIVDLDAPWDPDDYTSSLTIGVGAGEEDLQSQQQQQNFPILDLPDMFPAIKLIEETTGDYDDEIPGMALEEKLNAYQPLEDVYRWVDEARVMLSPRGRPAGWKIKFLNRSIVYAFLNSTQERALMCAWRVVATKEWSPEAERDIMPPGLTPEVAVSFDRVSTDEKIAALEPIGNNRNFYDELELDPLRMDWLDDSVVRVENCSEQVSERDLLHVFSRYDLKSPSVVRWLSGGMDVTRNLIPTFFIRFADASWARAAVREKQSTVICGKAIRLIQFPRQLIRTKRRQQTARGGATASNDIPLEEEEDQQSMTAEYFQ